MVQGTAVTDTTAAAGASSAVGSVPPGRASHRGGREQRVLPALDFLHAAGAALAVGIQAPGEALPCQGRKRGRAKQAGGRGRAPSTWCKPPGASDLLAWCKFNCQRARLPLARHASRSHAAIHTGQPPLACAGVDGRVALAPLATHHPLALQALHQGWHVAVDRIAQTQLRSTGRSQGAHGDGVQDLRDHHPGAATSPCRPAGGRAVAAAVRGCRRSPSAPEENLQRSNVNPRAPVPSRCGPRCSRRRGCRR